MHSDKDQVKKDVKASLDKLREKGNLKRGRQRRVVAVDPFRDELTKGNSSKQVRRTVEINDTADAMSRDNPVAFYTKFSKFALDAANLPFATPLGVQLNFPVSGTEPYYVPGVMVIEFIPTCGISTNFESAINRSSIRFYTYLRSNQKASGQYDHQDITMMELGMDSAYMFHAACRRAYGIIKNFTPVNRYYAETLVNAMGFNYSDLLLHLQDFRGYINTLAYSLGQYALPANITLFQRHQWMCEGYYTDSISTRAQTYVFVPKGFWQYDNTVETGSQLTFKQWAQSGPMTFSSIVSFGNDLVNAISNEEDFSVISGDIYNFYGGDTFKLPYTDENYVIYPAYSEVVLSQIENLTITEVNNLMTLTVSQNPTVNNGAIIFDPVISGGSAMYRLSMNFHHDSPSSEDVIEASRLMAVPDTNSYNSTTDTYHLLECGTELVHRCTIIKYSGPGLPLSSFPLTRNVLSYDVGKPTAQPQLNLLKWVSNVSQFDWAPGAVIRWYSSTDTSFTPTIIGNTWDIDNFSFVSNQYLSMIHTACLFSLFEVGDNGETVVSGR